MPVLQQLVLTSFRNIANADLRPGPGLNLLFGENGSGKTSVLEAIHLLGMGRSFRNQFHKALIQDGQTEAVVFGATSDGLSIGIQRNKGSQIVQVDGRKLDSLAELPRRLPLQLINTDLIELLEGSPQVRRRFLDWGVFHVEHQFLHFWRRFKRALHNRNSLLKEGASTAELAPWTAELCASGTQIHQFRQRYTQDLRLVLDQTLSRIPGLATLPDELHMIYSSGWSDELELSQQLERDLVRDRRYGHTCSGPHRADLRFTLAAHDAVSILSRGQLKLLACALKLAQASYLQAQNATACIFIVDDLAAELDAANRTSIVELLRAMTTQVFFTAIEKDSLLPFLRDATAAGEPGLRLFHVKHGRIQQISPTEK